MVTKCNDCSNRKAEASHRVSNVKVYPYREYSDKTPRFQVKILTVQSKAWQDYRQHIFY